MIAATGSGRGKTTFVTGLLKALKENMGNSKSIHAFKCGPDYIDPMFHRDVLGIPSTNLDSFFCNEALLNEVFNKNAGDINVVEAAMGLYDGIGTSKRASAMEIASLLGIKIVLLVDGSGMGYSIIPMIKGFLSEDENKLISGIVINRISERYYSRIAPVIEKETGIKVLGFLPNVKGAQLDSRHLGLVFPDEADFQKKVSLISEQIKKSVNIDGIIAIGTESNKIASNVNKVGCETTVIDNALCGKKIFVARDEAFTFCYEENIKLLKRLGASISFFSPLHDKGIGEDADVIILYGGYPENYAKELSSNKCMLESISRASNRGVKIIAECGGFMYLTDYISVDGINYEMAHVISGHAYRKTGLVRFGYVNVLSQSNDCVIKAHEFHHFDVDDVEYTDEYIVVNEATKEEYKGIVKRDNIFAGYPHLYYLSNPEFIVGLIK